MPPPGAARAGAAFPPAFLGEVVEEEHRRLGEIEMQRYLRALHDFRRYMLAALENSITKTKPIMIWSPRWIQCTGAKVLSSTRSVTTGP